MKNLTLLAVVLFFTLSVFSQEKVTLTICEKSTNQINISHLIECKMLGVDNSNYKVLSFSIGWASDDNYIESKMDDNTISDKAIELIKKSNPDILYVEQIVLINKKGEKLNVKSFKVKK